MKSNYTLLILALATIISSCKKEENNPKNSFSSKGVYVVNEGSFGSGNSSVSYLDFTQGVMFNNIFENANGIPLGDVAQSMSIHNNYGYVVVNNSFKVEVVSLDNFSIVHTITGLQGPRYMVFNNGKGYISDWFSNSVAEINLNTFAITKNIPTGQGPEQMLVDGNNLFVTNIGGYNNDSTVTVINTDAGSVSQTIQVGLNPNSIRKDVNGKIWILCGGSSGPDFIGGTADDIAGSIYKIDPITLNIEQQFIMNTADHPLKLQINTAGTVLYYLAGDNGYTGKIVSLLVSSTVLNPQLIINKEFYGLGLDPGNNIIYGGFAPGFSQNGYIFRYTGSGNLIDSLEAGIAPNNFAFR